MESTGKSRVAEYLSSEFDLPLVKEYARDYLNDLPRAYNRSDLDNILRGQLNMEANGIIKAVESGVCAVVCDTGPEVVYVWSQHKYGQVSECIKNALDGFDYDLVLLTDIDLEWTPDSQRETPLKDERRELFVKYVSLLQGMGVAYSVISGCGSSRFTTAKNTVHEFLNKKSPQQC